MPAQDAVRPVTTAAAGIQNGSLVTLVFESGDNSQAVCLNYSNEFESQGHTDELEMI